jgi:hypothetical protein
MARTRGASRTRLGVNVLTSMSRPIICQSSACPPRTRQVELAHSSFEFGSQFWKDDSIE